MIVMPSVGAVSARPGARLHLNLHGLASCGAGSGRVRGAVSPVDQVDTGRLCRRCYRRLGDLLAEVRQDVARLRYTGVRARLAAIDALMDALHTPAQIARLTELTASLRQFLAGEQGEQPAAIPLSTEGGTGQLALFAA